MQRCTHPPAEAPHLPLSAAVIPTRLWRYAARRWACTASSVYGLTTMPGPARPEKRDGGNCVHADWTGGLADRHAVGVAGHDVPQTMTNHLYLHTNTVVSTRYTTCIYAHTSRVRAHGSFRA